MVSPIPTMIDLSAALGHVLRNYFRDLSAIPQADYFGHRVFSRVKTAGGLRETVFPEMAFVASGGRFLTG